MSARVTTRAYVALGIGLVLWASAYAGIREGLKAYTPAHVALLRYLTAAVVLAIYAMATKMPMPRRRDLLGLAVTGAIGIAFYNVALNYGELTVPAGVASMLIASSPIMTALLAVAFLHERLTVMGWTGIVVSFGGVAIIALAEGGGMRVSPHALLIVAAALAAAIYVVSQKQYLRRYSALQFTVFTLWAGALFLLPFASGLVTQFRHAPLKPTLAIIYMGIFPAAIAYWAWAYYIAHAAVAKGVSTLYIVPVLAIGMAWLLLGEVPGWMSILGGAIALAGVGVVSAWGHAKTEEPEGVPALGD